MPNYSEEIVYWYLRLNGFFPLTNFVVHRGGQIRQSGDVDLLAIRPPFVSEPIGGQPDDWDKRLDDALDFSRTLGVICEVKTGDFSLDEVFPRTKLTYSVNRLGLTPQGNTERVVSGLMDAAVFPDPSGVGYAKLLVAKTKRRGHQDRHGFCIRLGEAHRFLEERVLKYPREKYAARMLFQNGVFQYIAGLAPV